MSSCHQWSTSKKLPFVALPSCAKRSAVREESYSERSHLLRCLMIKMRRPTHCFISWPSIVNHRPPFFNAFVGQICESHLKESLFSSNGKNFIQSIVATQRRTHLKRPCSASRLVPFSPNRTAQRIGPAGGLFEGAPIHFATKSPGS
jgi:hypothetical protein